MAPQKTQTIDLTAIEGMSLTDLQSLQQQLALAQKAANKAARDARRAEAEALLTDALESVGTKKAAIGRAVTMFATMLALDSKTVGIVISTYNENPSARG